MKSNKEKKSFGERAHNFFTTLIVIVVVLGVVWAAADITIRIITGNENTLWGIVSAYLEDALYEFKRHISALTGN